MRVIDHGLPPDIGLQHAGAFFEIGYAELWEEALLDITSVAQRCHLSRSAATRTVARLSDIPNGLGLISIQLETADRRRKRLRLTTNGRQIYFASLDVIQQLNDMAPDEMLAIDIRTLFRHNGHGTPPAEHKRVCRPPFPGCPDTPPPRSFPVPFTRPFTGPLRGSPGDRNLPTAPAGRRTIYPACATNPSAPQYVDTAHEFGLLAHAGTKCCDITAQEHRSHDRYCC